MENEQKEKIAIIRGLQNINEGESEICPLCNLWIHSGKVSPNDCFCSVGVIKNHFNVARSTI